LELWIRWVEKLILNNGGCSDTAIQTICYKDTVISYLPSAFTPDGDGINDKWIPRIYGANSVYIAIYNRWGQILHQSNDPDEGWDGVYLNKPVPEGIYTAYIELKGRKTAKRKEAVNIYLSRQKN
jgi:gliding motility-associated-like protein